jgi:hypothetical protein
MGPVLHFRTIRLRSRGFKPPEEGNKWIRKQRQLRAPYPDRTVSRGVKMSSQWMLSERETVVELPWAADS